MTAFKLKIIALITMIIDHIGVIIMPNVQELRVIGRVAFPIYVYLVAEGFRHTKNPKKFLIRLGIFALVSEPIFDLAMGNTINFLGNTNIFYTLFLGGAAIATHQWICKKWEENHTAFVLAFVPGLGFMWVAELLTTDYGAYGVAFITFMYAIKPIKLRLATMAILCVWQHATVIEFAMRGYLVYVPNAHLFVLAIPATLVAVVLVAFYNGERGIHLKWFFYGSYPVHLAILLGVHFLLSQ
ncbi:MAG: conjugal transfer protein TraX [Defluviitaleaceae bacterium]|nr:conjugal transfer protein TraX [Defluviitaleaceae bacterium]